jgi:hypothetical protein
MSVWISPDPSSWGGLAPVRPARRVAAAALLRLRLPIALSAGLVAGLVVFTLALPTLPTPARSVRTDALSGLWMPRPAAQPVVVFDAFGLAGLPRRYEALARERTDETGQDRHEREDRLTIGSMAGDAPFLRIILARSPDAGQPAGSFYIDSARRAADAGLAVDRFRAAGDFMTRFGAVETASVALSQGDTKRPDCLALRFGAADAALDFMALACPSAGRRFEEAQVACLFRTLDSPANGDEPSVRRYLQRSGREPLCEFQPVAPARVAADEHATGTVARPRR